MKAKIDKEGKLWLDKGNGYVLQKCCLSVVHEHCNFYECPQFRVEDEYKLAEHGKMKLNLTGKKMLCICCIVSYPVEKLVFDTPPESTEGG
jgi:hypothetical protein